ncbi:MAG TPA: alpha/beta hydrolase [Anaerolineales bacterium]|nr:alpha/beta hydrolase [Anaerolineales bacterium]
MDTPLVLIHGGPGLDDTSLRSLEPCADPFTLLVVIERAGHSPQLEQLAEVIRVVRAFMAEGMSILA